MQKVKFIIATAIVGATTACIYHLFERSVDLGIEKIWIGVFNTNDNRLNAFVLTVALGIIYFVLQHLLDPKIENKKEEALGLVPKATVKNLVTILILGFLSLFAGASLGPEAILIPASLVGGGIIGKYIFKSDQKIVKLLGSAGLVALFTAFFHSIIFGILSIYILVRKVKIKFNMWLLMIATVASASCLGVLKLIESDPYLKLPHHSWHFSLKMLPALIILFVCGYLIVYLMSNINSAFLQIKSKYIHKKWILGAILAPIILGAIYFIGGSLIEFTGNKSIKPMFEQAQELGLVGLLFIVITKIFSITWCKALGYRGGLIFATTFAASTIVAIVNLYIETNLLIGLVIVLVGVLIADRKYKYILG